jgi:hypothetical protein
LGTRLWRWLTGGSSDDSADSGTTTDAQGEGATSDPFATFSGESISQAKLVKEIGMTPQDFLLAGLAARGGRLRQQEIVEYSGWSESSVSRTLSAMEEDGRIVRVKIGRQKMVCLPEAAPERFDGDVDDVASEEQSPDDALDTADEGESGQSSV